MTTLHYLIRRSTHNKEESNEIIEKLLMLFEVSSPTKKVLYEVSLNNGLGYEDSIIYSSALSSKINIIVTKDKKVLKPQKFLAFYASEANGQTFK